MMKTSINKYTLAVIEITAIEKGQCKWHALKVTTKKLNSLSAISFSGTISEN